MYQVVKRILDITIALIALIVLTPFLIPIMIGLKLSDEGKVFFFQKRVGYKNKPFYIWKFVTMQSGSGMDDDIITMDQDPRITPLGYYLRKTKLNEIPQLINVIRGDMSFVGPRPVLPYSFDLYPDEVKDVIYSTKPGITGIGSILFRDEVTLVSKAQDAGIEPWDFYIQHIYPYKGKVERWYKTHQSLTTDLAIVLLTIWVILVPGSRLPYRIFKDLPPRPISLVQFVTPITVPDLETTSS